VPARAPAVEKQVRVSCGGWVGCFGRHNHWVDVVVEGCCSCSVFLFFGIVGIFRCVFSFVDPAGAYVNTLRPQRRPGSAGRARSDDMNKSGNKSGGGKKLQRPTTAPGRRREDQQVAHGMSGQMVDAASEEVSGLCLWRIVVETCC
jgi:hypothetical protein